MRTKSCLLDGSTPPLTAATTPKASSIFGRYQISKLTPFCNDFLILTLSRKVINIVVSIIPIDKTILINRDYIPNSGCRIHTLFCYGERLSNGPLIQPTKCIGNNTLFLSKKSAIYVLVQLFCKRYMFLAQIFYLFLA